jgi:hypothetical protein
MSGIRRRDDCAAIEIEAIRHALGAIALGEPAVFWVYRRLGWWWARREGAECESRFATRVAAQSHVELQAARCRSYRLFLEEEGGGFIEEHAGWPAAVRCLNVDDGGTVTDPA